MSSYDRYPSDPFDRRIGWILKSWGVSFSPPERGRVDLLKAAMKISDKEPVLSRLRSDLEAVFRMLMRVISYIAQEPVMYPIYDESAYRKLYSLSRRRSGQGMPQAMLAGMSVICLSADFL
jgi:hypothetical protein